MRETEKREEEKFFGARLRLDHARKGVSERPLFLPHPGKGKYLSAIEGHGKGKRADSA